MSSDAIQHEVLALLKQLGDDPAMNTDAAHEVVKVLLDPTKNTADLMATFAETWDKQAAQAFSPATEVEPPLETPKGFSFLQKIKDNKAAHIAAHGGQTIVYTDGGCQTAFPFIGSHAWTATMPNAAPKTKVATLSGTTNTRMELMAIYMALEELEIGPPIVLYADSMYAINCASTWADTWMKNGWKTSNGLPVKNRDLIEPVRLLARLHTIEFKHVKGHMGNGGNAYVDDLCSQAIKAVLKEFQVSGYAGPNDAGNKDGGSTP